jgi:hypothetical protein
VVIDACELKNQNHWDFIVKNFCRQLWSKMHLFLSVVSHGALMDVLWVCDFLKPFSSCQSQYLTGCSNVGVAFTKHLVHLYAYTGSNELAQRIEVRLFSSKVTEVVILQFDLHLLGDAD